MDRQLDVYGGGTPTVANGLVYESFFRALGLGDLRALDAVTGSTVWTITGGSNFAASSVDPVEADGVLYYGNAGGVLVAVNAATGARLWTSASIPGTSSGYFSVVVANGALYAVSQTAVSAYHP